MPATRPLRADARRNRDRLLAVAVAAFARGGDVTMDAIAREAGVGPGTLYRHFPTREALVEAAYRSELEKLCTAAPELLATLPPDAALRAWMDLFLDYLLTKRHMADALRAVVASGGNPFARSHALLTEAIGTLLDAGVAAGTVRPDVDPADILAGLSGIGLATARSGRRDQAGRLLDLLMDGLWHRPQLR
ncbi:MAG: TetR/AcrR family transcriptional regulator [Acidothermales bacterium]|nr:TetR/AcrR family transcriptional regulator [Acidothermales bacterium]